MSITNLKRAKNKLLAKAFTAVPSLATKWAEGLEEESQDVEVPWSQPTKPLSEATVALVTTGGVHLKNQTPFDMADEQGDATWRTIPVATPVSELEITHDYYNQADARKDLNLVLPIERLQELVGLGVVGKLHEKAISFMGHIDGPHVDSLNNGSAPEVAQMLVDEEVDYALLVPA